MNGIIWNKTREIFVPISSVPVYAMLQQNRRRQSREREIHNFQLQNFTVMSFQEPNFFEFYDNNTKVTRICGELWNILCKSLNFTHRMYINLESTYDRAWVAKVFFWEIWYVILAMHVLLSVCGFWSQIILARIGDKWKKTTFEDHFFYNFGMLCNQNYIPEILEGRSRILGTSLNFFCSVIYIVFGTKLFTCISKRVFIPPFDNLMSLVTNTKYKVLVTNGSIAHIAFQSSEDMNYKIAQNAKRIVVASTIEEIFKMVCYSKKGKYIIFESEEKYLISRKIMCHLTPIGRSYMNMWISSCIVKNFKYKRTIDLGILKLIEVGMLRLLKNRWLSEKIKCDDNVQLTEAITMDQVSLIITVMYCGMVAAFIIFIIEKIVYIYKFKK